MKACIGFCILAVAFARQDRCLPHQTYNECGTMCPLTCDNYENPPKICGLMCVPGCHCDEGYVLTKDQRCVKKEECQDKKKPDRRIEKYCLAESDPGLCKGSFRKWYYDAQSGTCRTFVYGGCQGNSNRFETKQECINRCKGVKAKRPKPLPNLCQVPADSGNCSAYFVRFYFDTISRQCKRFIYSGCNGNGNNFKSLRICERTCRNSKVKKTCTEKPESGMCMAAFRMWYYDPETQSCNKFIYGGCQGNGNRYWSEEECLEHCKGVTPEPQQLSNLEDVDCNALPDAGLCNALIPRFFYDPLDARCKKFMYGGCRGNSNNFETQEECNKKCGVSEDAFDAIAMPFSCDCESGNSTCACCGHMKITTIRLDKKVCVEVGYDENKKALQVTVKANDKVIYNNSISATNPPPVCMGMPPMAMFADVCFKFDDIKVSLEKIHFCLNVKPRLVRQEITDMKVGCFNFNKGAGETQQESEVR